MTAPDPQPPAAPENDVDWPHPGLLGRVKCSDGVWRTAFCVLGRGGSPEWVFADGARRRVDTSTAHSLVADTELGPLLADLSAARERVREVEGERDAAQLALGEQADIEREAFGRGVAWAMGDDEEAPARLLARAESAEAAHEALRAGVEALADEWKWYEAGDITDDLRSLLAGDAR